MRPSLNCAASSPWPAAKRYLGQSVTKKQCGKERDVLGKRACSVVFGAAAAVAEHGAQHEVAEFAAGSGAGARKLQAEGEVLGAAVAVDVAVRQNAAAVQAAPQRPLLRDDESSACVAAHALSAVNHDPRKLGV